MESTIQSFRRRVWSGWRIYQRAKAQSHAAHERAVARIWTTMPIHATNPRFTDAATRPGHWHGTAWSRISEQFHRSGAIEPRKWWKKRNFYVDISEQVMPVYYAKRAYQAEIDKTSSGEDFPVVCVVDPPESAIAINPIRYTMYVQPEADEKGVSNVPIYCVYRVTEETMEAIREANAAEDRIAAMKRAAMARAIGKIFSP